MSYLLIFMLDVSVDDCNSAAESTDSVEDFYVSQPYIYLFLY